jgi:dihydrolipoamide dehydrogenase
MSKNVAIIGAGPGGYRAAFMAAGLGLNVTVIDPEINPGGVCLYRGCIPTKALLHLVKVKKEALKASEWGLYFDNPKININRIRQWKDEVVAKLTGGLGQLVKTHKIEYIQGIARFTDSATLEIMRNEGSTEKRAFDNIIIATGSKPSGLPGLPLKSNRIMDSEESLKLENIPEHLLIVGGGYIGLEMATIYKGLGSKISIVELTDNFMPGMDEDLVRVFRKAADSMFDSIHLESRIAKVEEKDEMIKVYFEDINKTKWNNTYDKILVAIGQKPNTENLGLENTKVETDDKGFIRVNYERRTTDNRIFAIGDVTGGLLLAHKASHEGRVAAEAIAGKKTAFDPKAIPAVVYTDPEIAVCGISEVKAKGLGIRYKTAKFPWTASGRNVAMGNEPGLTKLIVDTETERLLGAGIVGKNAGDIISEVALAIEMAALASDITLTVHPHPTLSETIMEAAEAFYGFPTHTFVTERKRI